jgi:protein-serine/threonine kinase
VVVALASRTSNFSTRGSQSLERDTPDSRRLPYNTMEGPESSAADLASSIPPHGHRLADSHDAPGDGPPTGPPPPTASHGPSARAHANAPSVASNTLLPSFASGNSHFHYHIRAPSTGLTLQTDFSAYLPSPAPANTSTSTLEASGTDSLRQSATAPIAIQDQSYLRTAWSADNAGSLSPGSVLSSPALNALGDLTPLPSPLVMSDSPGPWQRAVQRPRSRGASGSSLGDSIYSPTRGGLSPSGSLKKKGYHGLKEAAIEAAAQKNEAARERNRSISEFTPDALHNARPRHVTIGNASMEVDASVQQHMHREVYLAAQRGLVPGRAAGLPTPPASNASNRSVTDTEEEDIAEDDNTKYIVVRQGPQKMKKLWRPVRQLGQGTFSKVYLATCEKTKAKDPLDEAILDPRKLVAIKVVEHGPAGGADEERVELSLKREVEMLRSVSHPSLVHLQAFDHDDAQALIVLSYCPGGDLFDVASDHRDKLTIGIVQRIFAEMVSAVRYLHKQLIVHRDIKLESTVHYFLTRSPDRYVPT